MAGSSGDRSSILSLPNILLVVLMATGFAVYRQPLRAPRADTGAAPDERSASDDIAMQFNKHNSAEVPLWQDPFSAVGRFERSRIVSSARDSNVMQTSARPWENLWAPSALSDSKRRVMMVMTPFEKTQEAVEYRLRSRQAVIGALRSEGFTPVHPGIVFHVVLPLSELSLKPWETNRSTPESAPASKAAISPPRPAAQNASWQSSTQQVEVRHVSQDMLLQPHESPGRSEDVVVLPYEWYLQDEVRQRAGYSSALQHVLVVWLPEGKFGNENLAALERIMGGIQSGLPIASSEDLRNSPAPEAAPPAPFEPAPAPTAEAAAAAATSGPAELFAVSTAVAHQRAIQDNSGEASFALIGPTSSTTLSAMYKEAADPHTEGNRFTHGPQLSIYVTTPSTETFFTTSLEDAQQCSSLGALDESFAETLRQKTNLRRFFRVCETDDVVAGGLVRELQSRGLNIIPTSADWKISQANHDEELLDNVALICEHETLFGRAFAQTFSASLWHHAESDEQSYRERDGLWRQSHGSLPPNLHVYFYPRGIKDQAAQQLNDTNASNSSAPSTTISPQMPERPEGLSQLDYIRRLANSLSLEYRRAGRYRLRAIGIVGTDVYDKMLLLQALRAEFPDMLFFTTDLDARLLHYTNFHFTRNLIVGSTYGLTLRDRYQRTSGIAAFRDSGQTAAYVACRLAISADHSNGRSASTVNPDELGVILPEQVHKSIREPLMFEVGREVAVTLSPLVQDADSLHPAPFRPIDASNWFFTLTAVALFMAMVVYVFTPARNRLSGIAYAAFQPFGWRPANDPLHQADPRPVWHQSLRDKRRRLLWVASGISVVIGLALVVAIYHSHYGGGEPFAIMAGYSTWPSIIINQLALILTLFFLVESWYTIRYTECRLDHDFHLGGQRVAARAGFLLPLSVWWPGLQDGRIQVDSLWEQCKSLGSLSNRFARVGIMFMILSAFWATMYLLYGDSNDPLRGNVNLFWGRVMSNCSLALLAWLTLFVVDATTLVLVFVRNLAGHESAYNPATLNRLWSLHFVENTTPTTPPTPPPAVPAEKLQRIVPFADITVIGELTNSVYQIILFPFIALTLMILARSGFFDNFAWSKVMLTVYGMLFGYAIWCAIVLQRTSEQTRQRAIETLHQKLDAVRVGEPSQEKNLAPLYDAVIRQTQNVSHGAFMALVDNPLLRAVLLPTGGTTLLALLQYLSSGG